MKLRRCSGTAAAVAAAAKAANCRVGVRAAAAAAAAAEEEEGVDAVTVRWLQYAGLQHLASPAASADQRRRLRSLLAQGYGAEIAEGNQMLSSLLRNLNFSTQSCTDAYEQDVATEFTGKLGTGLLDLHAVDDTELLSENLMAEMFNPSLFAPSRGPSNDFDSVIREQNLQGQPDCNYRASVGAKEKKVAKIRVVVRKRPPSKEEISRKEGDIITVDDNSHITIHEPKLKVDLTAYEEKHRFHFDAVLDENVTSDEVYRVTVEPIVPTIFQQGKVTCFAFGQTGSGKTFTMQPLPLRASEEIFRLLRQTNSHNQNLKLWLSYFEIYCGNLFDLLNDRRKLCMREDGHQQVCIVGLQEYEVSDVQIVEELIQKGNSVRITGSTVANDESSRSHAILQLTIKNHDDVNDTRRNSKKRVAKDGTLVGKISFIDLAGTERGADSIDNDRIKRTEGAEINKGLMALKECIRALDSDQINISFRGSKLTEVLRDSFVGNTRTVVIACISPSTGSCEPTLNTLRYADRFKSLSKGSYSANEYSAIAEEESPLASSLRFLVESEDIYEQDNAEAEHTTIFGRKIENNENDPVPENGRNSFRFEPNYDYSRREVGGTSLNVLEIYQHNAQNTSSGYKTHATAQFSLSIYYKEKPKRKEKHSCSSKNCGSMVSPKGYEKQQMHGSSSSTVVCLYGEEINTKFEEKDDLISSRRNERENIRDIACDVYSTTKSLSSESNSLSCVMGWNDAQSTCGDSSTYESDLTTQRSSDIHENENVPRVSSPSRNLMRDEKSKIRSNSSMRESRSKMAPKSHTITKNQIHDPCSNTWAGRYEEETPSQDSMSERDSNLSSFMFEDNSNERKEDGIAYDTLEMGRNNTQNTHGCTSNIDKPDFSTRDVNTAVEEESRRVPTYSEQTKTTDSFSSEYGNNSSGTEDGGPRSPTLEMGQNDIGSCYRNNSTYKSDSSMQGTLNLNDRENSPTVSSPSGELNEEEKSEIQISNKEDRASKLFPKSSGEVQIHNRGSNISVSLHEEEAPSQERDINREEDALISAHVNLLENAMDIMHEEMKLLVEVDKPGNPIDKYVARLSLLLSRKAADLASLQKGLVKFQLRLQEHGILRNSNIP